MTNSTDVSDVKITRFGNRVYLFRKIGYMMYISYLLPTCCYNFTCVFFVNNMQILFYTKYIELQINTFYSEALFVNTF